MGRKTFARCHLAARVQGAELEGKEKMAFLFTRLQKGGGGETEPRSWFASLAGSTEPRSQPLLTAARASR